MKTALLALAAARYALAVGNPDGHFSGYNRWNRPNRRVDGPVRPLKLAFRGGP
jgi:hypothetical protein